MSKVAIKGADTGTGVFTLESPATNTDRTLTLPDEAGTVLTTATAGVPVNGPAFSAYVGSNQSVSHATYTKLSVNTEEFDTNSNYDSVTNYRFTPTVAGYYQVNGQIALNGGWTSAILMVFKNGSRFKDGVSPNGASMFYVNVATLVYLNGSTDYIELYVYQATGSTQTVSGTYAYDSYFQAAMVRAA